MNCALSGEDEYGCSNMIQPQPVQPVVQDDSDRLVKLPEEHQQRRIVVEDYPEYPSIQNHGKKSLMAVRPSCTECFHFCISG